MAKSKAVSSTKGRVESRKHTGPPACLAIAVAGVKTGGQFAALMSATIADLITGAISPQVGNAVCNAGGKLLKVVEMQYKWGSPGVNGDHGKELTLVR